MNDIKNTIPYILSSDFLNVTSKISEELLWARHMVMSEFGSIGGGGVNRQALSVAEFDARKKLLEWANEINLVGYTDAIGNLFLRREGEDKTLPAVMTGSHIDTQPMGGRFDGIYGILAGLEALRAIDVSGIKLNRSIELVVWTNEEGSRFLPGAMGSAIFSGYYNINEVCENKDDQGITLRDALSNLSNKFPELVIRETPSPISCYLEAHIEQGPILENTGVSIGVVTGVQGCRWYTVEVIGETAHAGTTPITHRRDAVREAVECIKALQEVMRDELDILRFTVGRFNVTPGSINSVASRVIFTIDIRHPESTTLEHFSDLVEKTCKSVVLTCEVIVVETLSHSPSSFDQALLNLIGTAANNLELSTMKITSGAFHDAQNLNNISPTGMIFVPCERGISHNPAENAKSEDLANGARVLLLSLLRLAG